MVSLAIKTASGLCSTLAPIMAFTATLPACKWIFTKLFGMAKLLSVEASQRVWDVHLDLNFQDSQVSSFDFSTLYTSLPHDLIKAKVLSLVEWCFDRESKTYLCTSAKAGFFSNKKYDSYACWTCTELCEAFTFLLENIYVQFDGMVYQQIVGIPMGTSPVRARGVKSRMCTSVSPA